MGPIIPMRWILSLVLLQTHLVRATTSSQNSKPDCPCGYYDASAKNLFTDSIIVYFNETDTLDSTGFVGQTYQHAYEKGWNAQYRQGADLEHITIGNDTTTLDMRQSVALNISKATPDHLIMGGAIQTERRDIHYGSFRTLLRSPRQWSGGSALSMEVFANETQTWSLNLYSTEDPKTARVTMLMNREFPDAQYGVNYTTLTNDTTSPWDYMEYRVDWTKDYINYFGNKAWRTVSRRDGALPTTPGPLHFKHWCTGDFFAMQGPPWYETTANVGWARLFFNVTSTSQEERDLFDSKCHTSDACSVEDMSLRGHTAYSEEATVNWKQASPRGINRTVPIVICVVSIAISTFLVLNAVLRRRPWQKWGKKNKRGNFFSGYTFTPSTTSSTQRLDRPQGMESLAISEAPTLVSVNILPPGLRPSSSEAIEPVVNDPVYVTKEMSSLNDSKGAIAGSRDVTEEKTTLSPKAANATLPVAKKRVDYLAGLVAVSSLLVTGIHFGLTFIPAAINPGAFVHYQSEVWARKTINPFLLNLIWIGPFLMTSSRFLSSSYLRTGNLKPVAEKVVGRTPRLIIPIMAIALLEYFLMNAGAVDFLMLLPSITWSTWPFTAGYNNIGDFFNEILELTYLIPNAAPQITFNYCTGVLWTIPVQLQGSWLVLLGAIVIREIKTPWKRMAYYIFCIVNSWYALSWGSYFWLGLLLADLDITYKYRKWLYARALAYYPLLVLCFILGFGGLSVDLATQWTQVNYATFEYGIHPDAATGLPIAQTPGAGYPQYYVPKLHGLVFALGFQALVELSPLVQKLLSFKLFVMLFPHIFTIYLIHGFIFWSLGATLCVKLFGFGLPYWANLLIVALCCYTVLVISLPILTPVVETLGKSITADVWRFAHEKPPLRKPTLYPFTQELIVNRANDPAVTVITETREERNATIV